MANNRVQVKRTSTTGRTPNTTGSYATNSQYISAGELALNMTDGILYSSDGTNLITVGSNLATQRITSNITLDNNTQLRFRTVNSSAFAYFTQQSDDNFVFYTTNASYGARAVFSIFANSSTSDFQLGQPVTFNGANVKFSTGTALFANGSGGSAGQVLSSNGSTVYWASPGAASVNVSAQYNWTNLHTFSANVSFTGNGIGLTTNTAAIYLNGLSDANWKIGRNTGATTKWRYTNNSIDVIVAASALEGYAIGLVSGNSYFETGYLGTYIAANVTIGNSASNSTINSTGFAFGTSFIANNSQVTISGLPLSANGGVGSAGQVLTSNGATGSPYWASAAAGVNTAATYNWTNTHNFNSNTTVGNATFANTFLNSYTGISNPQSLTAGVLQTDATLNTLIVGPYTISSGNSLIITTGSRLVVI